MKRIDDLLVEHEFFKDFVPEHRELIAGCGRNRTIKAGDYLLREGDPANEFFAIRKGQVALGIHVPNKGEAIIETLHEGDVAGWSWLFEPFVTHFDARAVVTTNVIAFDGACLRRKCEEDPRLGFALMKHFARVMIVRMQATRLQLLDVYGTPR
ncbi:MAG TPA: cyclic nucleotide-binding domain-containing protein [Blastocatellia bacterium]|nr:cyclic nucleotide-binding domain-containing protein [Blastocatellia bacterium]